MAVGDNLSNKGKEDLELVNSALKGDQLAYAKLMKKYRDSIYFMMVKMVNNTDDADDLTIEAFGKAFNRLHQYTPNYAFSTWLFKIASNNCIDFIRKKKMSTMSIDQPVSDDDGGEMRIDVKSQQLDPEEKVIRKQKIRLMRKLVDKLKPRYKELVVLRYFKEYSYEEIAKELDIPLGTVKAQLYRAREALYNLIKDSKDKI